MKKDEVRVGFSYGLFERFPWSAIVGPKLSYTVRIPTPVPRTGNINLCLVNSRCVYSGQHADYLHYERGSFPSHQIPGSPA